MYILIPLDELRVFDCPQDQNIGAGDSKILLILHQREFIAMLTIQPCHDDSWNLVMSTMISWFRDSKNCYHKSDFS